jgi:hypothetical protein
MMKVSTGQLDDATRAALASGRAEPALGLFVDSLMQMRGISDIAAEVVSLWRPNSLPRCRPARST